MRCTTGAGAGVGAGAVLVVLEKEMQPEPSVAAARTNPRDKNFIMQVPKRRLWRKRIRDARCLRCRPNNPNDADETRPASRQLIVLHGKFDITDPEPATGLKGPRHAGLHGCTIDRRAVGRSHVLDVQDVVGEEQPRMPS